ncbi:hypothetical protein ABIE78_000162 [Sinorhizobium fredii]|uniref:Uncharacterized protein n=2 Tax=Sinorhizobium TaxID=28105 RepID=G9AC88_SINF1|nr:hypothetical protein SJ05684_a37630 [Sinorhizobium sojae CCBAU 05684]AWI61776.1 hypothetical protein AB395_00004251 [Sinorhizobium fredii CCBAU 45436]AWM29717.1 hypothetical protein AOX55_00004281 [Sinorhizobium fredii CCBAU 25509]CCE98667.1 hypothetical protein SFHH103_04178 [Sinorhizobium fredii HH103]GEC35744.1 hypothetical protein EFR01_59150 [Sinorhizobium fredii]
MLSFPLTSVREAIARGRADAEAHGGFRNPYYGLRPGKDEQPGLWLVGDQGVYLMSNGKLPMVPSPLSSMPRNAIPAPMTTGSLSNAGHSAAMTVSISSMRNSSKP